VSAGEKRITAVDLRSDTATRPSPEMWEAMARAEVGNRNNGAFRHEQKL
jgi:threonine aldolase